MDKLSVIVITFNEEKNIRRCLESVTAVADEIVVVDSLSTDSTEEICKDFNVRFVSQKWLGFSEQKNFANSLASNDWIFSIDADEALSPELCESIKKLKETGFDGAYRMNRLMNFCDHWIHHSGWYPDAKIRIWNKNEGVWAGDIHEVLKFTKDIEIHQVKGDLYHYSYLDIADNVNRLNKYTELTSRVAFEKGKTVRSAWGVYFRTLWRFINDYFFRLGILDGYYGYIACKMSSFYTFMKYSKLHELSKNRKK